MITKFDKFNLIKETPDTLNYDGDSYSFYNRDAYAFYIDVNQDHTKVKKLYIEQGKTHGDFSDYSDSTIERAYAGRLWVNIKVITFWVYPNEILFKDIIKHIEDKLNIKMFNNDWKIEVVKKDNEIKRRKFEPDKTIKTTYNGQYDDYYFGIRTGNNKEGEEIIPIEDYIGSEDFPEELRIQHMLKWDEKEKEKKKHGVKGFGSAKTAWEKPHNIKYRQAIYQENKKNDDN
jgi:hypothetical protein